MIKKTITLELDEQYYTPECICISQQNFKRSLWVTQGNPGQQPTIYLRLNGHTYEVLGVAEVPASAEDLGTLKEDIEFLAECLLTEHYKGSDKWDLERLREIADR